MLSSHIFKFWYSFFHYLFYIVYLITYMESFCTPKFCCQNVFYLNSKQINTNSVTKKQYTIFLDYTKIFDKLIRYIARIICTREAYKIVCLNNFVEISTKYVFLDLKKYKGSTNKVLSLYIVKLHKIVTFIFIYLYYSMYSILQYNHIFVCLFTF